MRITFYATLEQADRESLQGAVVVVIDVLRATSTILAALDRGAKRIIPVEDIETATRLVRPNDRGSKLLVGERKGLPIEGFDLFNSPQELTPDVVKGKTLILTTSNGTRSLAAAAKAARILICSINNVGAVAGALGGEEDVMILCSGTEGRVASEDLLCGGLLLGSLGCGADCGDLDDTARLAVLVADTHGSDIEGFLRSSDRGRALIELGYETDVVYCSMLDSSSRVPEFEQGAVIA